jgi:hypothetical protein
VYWCAVHSQQQYDEAERQRVRENQKITKDFQRTASAYSNLQAKFHHFKEMYRARYFEVGILQYISFSHHCC